MEMLSQHRRGQSATYVKELSRGRKDPVENRTSRQLPIAALLQVNTRLSPPRRFVAGAAELAGAKLEVMLSRLAVVELEQTARGGDCTTPGRRVVGWRRVSLERE